MGILDDIQNNYKKRLWIKRDCNKLKKKFSTNSAKDLGVLTELIILLYIFKGYAEALELNELIAELSFNGNYTIWTKIVNARMVIARIYREQGHTEKVKTIINEILPTMREELYMNQKKCLDLYDSNIADAKERNSRIDIIGWSLIKLEMMIRFSEIPNFPIDKNQLNTDIEKLRAELTEIILWFVLISKFESTPLYIIMNEAVISWKTAKGEIWINQWI